MELTKNKSDLNKIENSDETFMDGFYYTLNGTKVESQMTSNKLKTPLVGNSNQQLQIYRRK